MDIDVDLVDIDVDLVDIANFCIFMYIFFLDKKILQWNLANPTLYGISKSAWLRSIH